jgi:hypothetical protein
MSRFASQVVLHDLARPTPKDENACRDPSQEPRTGGGECEALLLLLGCPRDKYTIVQETRGGLVGRDGGGLQVWSRLKCKFCLLL